MTMIVFASYIWTHAVDKEQNDTMINFGASFDILLRQNRCSDIKTVITTLLNMSPN